MQMPLPDISRLSFSPDQEARIMAILMENGESIGTTMLSTRKEPPMWGAMLAARRDVHELELRQMSEQMHFGSIPDGTAGGGVLREITDAYFDHDCQMYSGDYKENNPRRYAAMIRRGNK
jgi:hypothetical protein